MERGEIKWFKDNKGYGFIRRDGLRDLFFHISNVVGNYIPKEDDPVEFEIGQGRKGPQALNVRRVADAAKESQGGGTRRATQQKSVHPRHNNDANQSRRQHKFPYQFKERPDKRINDEPLKKVPQNRHHRLNEGCFDIAFEVKWKALTPIAANPCSSGESCPRGYKDEFQGLDKRWLKIRNRLCISPFTVKSTVANGFAALLGSCYRVNTEVVAHPDDPDPAKFPYSGGWKRYRVSMSNSRPGLLKSINYDTGEVEVIPVTEYYYDNADAPPAIGHFSKGTSYHISYRTNRRKKIISRIQSGYFQGSTKVKYYGPYRFGMNLSFGPGDFNKHHCHRFYEVELDQEGKEKTISGRVNTLNLKSLEEQKKHVYMGTFKKFFKNEDEDKRKNVEGKPWHQDLTEKGGKLKKKNGQYPWIYYQLFNGKVAAIGLNFQFKTAFHVDDAVPGTQNTDDAQHACTSRDLLCPRCSMFGMTDKDQEAVGFKGRFRASALVGPEVGEAIDTGHDGLLPDVLKKLKVKKWMNPENPQEEVARQLLLPIQGEPKPCKRDQTAYFDKKTGEISGVKIYRHAAFSYNGLKDEIKRVNTCKTLGDFFRPFYPRDNIRQAYTHTLRNFAMVCRENTVFTGVLGAENATAEEAAALTMLLDHDIGGHGFKIGLGKALGLGSMVSEIKCIWIREPGSYTWEQIGHKNLKDNLKDKIDKFEECLKSLKDTQKFLNQLDLDEAGNIEDESTLMYPPMGQKYWSRAG